MITQRTHFIKDGELATIVSDGTTFVVYLPDDHRVYKSYGRAAAYLEAHGWSIYLEIFE